MTLQDACAVVAPMSEIPKAKVSKPDLSDNMERSDKRMCSEQIHLVELK